MSIVKQNPFRVLGLLGDSTERELQKQIATIKRFAEVGKTKSFDYDFEFLGAVSRDMDDIQHAARTIEQAHKKLLYSLFWFVKNNRFDEIALNNLKDQNHLISPNHLNHLAQIPLINTPDPVFKANLGLPAFFSYP